MADHVRLVTKPTYLHYLDALTRCTDALEDVVHFTSELMESQKVFLKSVEKLTDICQKLADKESAK